jgi:hypothetical protein
VSLNLDISSISISEEFLFLSDWNSMTLTAVSFPELEEMDTLDLESSNGEFIVSIQTMKFEKDFIYIFCGTSYGNIFTISFDKKM